MLTPHQNRLLKYHISKGRTLVEALRWVTAPRGICWTCGREARFPRGRECSQCTNRRYPYVSVKEPDRFCANVTCRVKLPRRGKRDPLCKNCLLASKTAPKVVTSSQKVTTINRPSLRNLFPEEGTLGWDAS